MAKASVSISSYPDGGFLTNRAVDVMHGGGKTKSQVPWQLLLTAAAQRLFIPMFPEHITMFSATGVFSTVAER